MVILPLWQPLNPDYFLPTKWIQFKTFLLHILAGGKLTTGLLSTPIPPHPVSIFHWRMSKLF